MTFYNFICFSLLQFFINYICVAGVFYVFKRYFFCKNGMKLVSQILGSVSPSTVSSCAGNLLFISNREIILSPGDDGAHISFHHSSHDILCIGASLNEPIFATGFAHGFDVFRIVSSQMSCRSLSKLMEREVSTPTESPVGYHEFTVTTEFNVKQLVINAAGDYIAVTDGVYKLQIFQIFFGENAKLNGNLIYDKNMKTAISQILISSNHNLLVNLESTFKIIKLGEFHDFSLRHPAKVDYCDWRYPVGSESSVLLTSCRNVLRIWRENANGLFELVAAKKLPNKINFSWLNNKYYNKVTSEKHDFLVGISEGSIHFWSISNLHDAGSSVIVSTLRMIPGVYPLDSDNVNINIQVRPCISRLQEAARKSGTILVHLLN